MTEPAPRPSSGAPRPGPGGRRLQAIVFTDIVGSTATMQVDERAARRLRAAHRDAVDGATARWRGELIQYYGDGSLAVFESAVDAVHSAVEVQRAARAADLPLRIGLHSGDVLRDDDGVFGDSVNVAARLESLCIPGAVLISDKVREEIENQPDLETVPLGTFHLRNVARPTEVHAVAAPGVVVPRPSDLARSPERPPASVAVLPFTNMTPDPENAWFADGLAEELINALARVPGLKVTARTSSFAFREGSQDVREIARALGVGAILEGSVRRAGSRVRLTAQLVDATDGFHLFSEVYDRTLDDVFAVQDEVARTIVGELEPRLLDTPSSSVRHARVQGDDWQGEAYELYLRARAEVARWTPDSMRAALEHCTRSLELDPHRAPPLATIATAYVFLGGLGQMSPDEAYPAAAEAIERALARDPHDDGALTNRALLRVFADGDGAGALDAIAHALTVAPGSAFAHQAHAYVLLHDRRFDEAVEAAEAAVELDPLSPPLLDTLGTAYMTAGRLGDARRVLERALAIAPTFRSAIQTLAWTDLQEGDLERAVERMDSLPALAGFPAASAGPRGYLYARLGRLKEAREMATLVRERQEAEPHLRLELDLAIIHLALGETAEMLELLERSAALNPGSLYFLRWAGLWDEVRDHPRIRALLGS